MYRYTVKVSAGMRSSTLVSDNELKNSLNRECCVHPEHVQHVRQNLLESEHASAIAALFAILGDPTRLQVVYALLMAPTGELCVGDLAAGLGRDDTTISHQLRVLRNMRIVTMRKVGRVVYYRLIDKHIRQLLEIGMAHVNERFPGYASALEAEVRL
jgi:DNA-binding transcriptional ArsR family regulator